MTRKDTIVEHLMYSKDPQSSGDVHAFLVGNGEDVSLVTVKRELSQLEALGLIESVGAGRSTAYSITVQGRLSSHIDLSVYSKIEPDKRNGMSSYNFDLFKAITLDPFSENEISQLDEATCVYVERIKGQTPVLHEKELERFVIELSWKSSRIEGNTYTLLDTERLLRDGIRAEGKTQDEAQMILNHKEAFKYIYSNKDQFKTLTRALIEDVHTLLVKDLPVSLGLRSHAVGVTGSTYIPLDNQFQIREAVDDLCVSISKMPHGYARSLISLLGLSYIQPFEDGNKRTSRLMANAILLASGLAPLSYRSVDEDTYREAILVFYELNSLVPFKKIFIEQYEFAAKNYLV